VFTRDRPWRLERTEDRQARTTMPADESSRKRPCTFNHVLLHSNSSRGPGELGDQYNQHRKFSNADGDADAEAELTSASHVTKRYIDVDPRDSDSGPVRLASNGHMEQFPTGLIV